ncbi:hypothetical protein TBLA_0G00780 [Henningerozyma blattae CBS 6284]|uniref:Trehalase n=1 Tax=Henningerozyma blattae (strain ATCC 34711 / CBS 6284 / DSM 70876 / NBRC 10599 / NRRL Y-10934 / UCD 77-7) TaxID=1071380 RepID=I2H6M3_HENB6|nr:hypothetical protein TBLA_0G00780 [Tetrapisispora blattae CBS 6284]CCH62025.1 hypothetical protein TBLA_0G00780 [Tetrapisispora blattae CBS 6284]
MSTTFNKVFPNYTCFDRNNLSATTNANEEENPNIEKASKAEENNSRDTTIDESNSDSNSRSNLESYSRSSCVIDEESSFGNDSQVFLESDSPLSSKPAISSKTNSRSSLNQYSPNGSFQNLRSFSAQLSKTDNEANPTDSHLSDNKSGKESRSSHVRFLPVDTSPSPSSSTVPKLCNSSLPTEIYPNNKASKEDTYKDINSTDKNIKNINNNQDIHGTEISDQNDSSKDLWCQRRRMSSLNEFYDPFSNAEIYCGPAPDPKKEHPENISKIDTDDLSPMTKKKLTRTRTMSTFDKVSNFKSKHPRSYELKRRGSEDESSATNKGSRKLYIENVDKTLEDLLTYEDTDRNYQITVEDTGPKVLKVGTANSWGYNYVDIRGTYMLSNLLQELTIAKSYNRHSIFLDEARLNENPVSRLTRLISTQFWNNLTRKIHLDNIGEIALDTKITLPGAKVPRVYVPYNCSKQYEFYIQTSRMHPSMKLEVEYLPEKITPEYVKSINGTPGLLAIAMEEHFDPSTGELTMTGYPYCVPGGRFNELYGWDSYLIALGLLENGKTSIARGMVEHFIFEIEHYGKILNANRSYYLCRSQPPFLTDMALKVFNKMGGNSNSTAVHFIKRAYKAAIKEYKTVWMSEPRLDKKTRLSCYHPDGIGIPPETEPSHFDTILTPFALKHAISLEEFRDKYNNGEIIEPDLDEFFLHDRAVRESGHDTTYRFEGVCAYLATIDLNSLLYKYEMDIADFIEKFYDGSFTDLNDSSVTTGDDWRNLASLRIQRINKYLWDENTGFYYDYNVKLEQRTSYESATTFWSLWAGLASQQQANLMVEKALPKLEVLGGLVACSENSRGPLSINRPSRQWDYPYGWAPHQIFAWEGLKNYGFLGVSKRLAYRWLYIMTKAFVDYNGIVVEKYDVTRGNDPHKVDAEYGNQGADFKGVAKEGFGWVNSSYILGLKYMNGHSRRGLGSCIPPVPFFNSLKPNEKEGYGLSS